MKRRIALLLSVLLLTVAFIGCDNSTEPEMSDYEVLTTYLTENNMDLTDVASSWNTTAQDVQTNKDSYYLIDIRAAADYDAGHIEGAVNSTLGNILQTAENADGKTPIVICYSGQSAAHGVVALRLSGYTDAKTMLFGMSSWNDEFDVWSGRVGNEADNYADAWSNEAPAALEEYDPPEWDAAAEDGAGILAERVEAMLNGGFKAVGATDVLSAPDTYFVNTYWAQSDWETYGHIDGAYRIFNPELSIEEGGIRNLNPDETIVTYCWTGQTSSIVTAYLSVLGYDARSLTFGVNGMIYDDLQSHKWSANNILGGTYVTE